MLADPEREVYAQYGLEKALLVIQRTASVVVDRNGVMRYIKRATNPMTWLKDSSELIDFIEALNNDENTGRGPDEY